MWSWPSAFGDSLRVRRSLSMSRLNPGSGRNARTSIAPKKWPTFAALSSAYTSRAVAARGDRYADGVRSQDAGPPERRDHEGCGVCRGDPDHARLEGHHRVVSRDPVVVRVPHGREPDRGLAGLADREFHRLPPHDLTEPVPAVDEDGRAGLLHDPARVPGDDGARLDPGDVAGEAGDSVGPNAPKVCGDQNV